MKTILATGLCLVGAGAGSLIYAGDVVAPVSAGTNAVVASSGQPSAKELADDPMRIEFSESGRQLVAYFQNTTQARLRIYSVTRFDPEIARPRRYFMGELTSAAIIEPVVFDVDNAAGISAFTELLKRFVDESVKSGQLKTEMRARKVRLDATLSREETLLVEQQADATVSKDMVAATRSRIESLKREILLAGELGDMEKITGKLGSAKINPDRPPYEFVASFEPNKMLYQLRAGYSFAVSDCDAKFCLELLSKAKSLKNKLIEHESRQALLRKEVDSFFSGKSE